MRCNCGIDPKNLTDEHLFAESRELKMLPSLFKRVGYANWNKVPKTFTLGKGHMLFFLYKAKYTYRRYMSVLKECQNRGIDVKNEAYRWFVYNLDGDIWREWKEDGTEKQILINRITEKIKLSPKEYFHYYHKRITKEEAIELLRSDAHYMDTAVFDTQSEALKFAHDMANQKKTKANIVIINVK